MFDGGRVPIAMGSFQLWYFMETVSEPTVDTKLHLANRENILVMDKSLPLVDQIALILIET